MAEWRRHHDHPHREAHVPAGCLEQHVAVTSLRQIVEIVADASRAGGTVRVCGSHWSMSPVVCDRGYTGRLLETSRLDRTLYHVIPACLTDEVRNRLVSQPPGHPGELDEARHTLYHVEAGITLRDLYRRLDAQGPQRAAPTDRLGAPGLSGPWALPTMPAACGQTLAGAVSTSTHGADRDRPPLADSVQAVHLVGPGGHEFWIERRDHGLGGPMCDLDRLRTVLDPDAAGSVRIVQDDDALDAVLVSLGRMGVIYSVVLRVVAAHGIEETRVTRRWSGLRSELLDRGGDLFAQRGSQVVVNPMRRRGERTCWVTRRRTIPLPEPLPGTWVGRRRRGAARSPASVDMARGGLRRLVCRAPSLAWLLGAAGAGVAAPALAASLLGHPPRRWLASVLLPFALAATAATTTTTVSDLVAAGWNFAARRRWYAVLAALTERAIAAEQPLHPPERPLRDISYAVLDRHDYGDRCCVRDGDALEVAFDADTDAAVRFVEECLFARVDGRLTRRAGSPAVAGAAYVSLRFTAGSRALLGIQRWPRTCHVAISGLSSFAGTRVLLDELERDAIDRGATVHWGQRNHLDEAAVVSMYPALDRWRAVLRSLSAHGDPAVFSTGYTRRAGLEP